MSSQADDINWAVHEFADADLGDVRRTKRLVELAHVLAQHPTAALPKPVAMVPCSKPPLASFLMTP